MKKIICAFAAGQALQILLLFLSESMTYSDKALGFCTGVGLIVLVALCVGAWGAIFAPAPAAAEERVVARHVAPAVPEKAKLRNLFPHWQIEDIEDMDEVEELPAQIRVTNSSVIREEAADV